MRRSRGLAGGSLFLGGRTFAARLVRRLAVPVAAAGVGGRAGVPQPLTRNSRTVRHANGSYTTTIFPGSVNYRTAASWRPIDSSLVGSCR